MIELIQMFEEFYAHSIFHNPFLIALFFLIIFNSFLGHARAWATKTFDSSKSRTGIIKDTALILALFMVCPFFHMYDACTLLNVGVIFLSVSYGHDIMVNYMVLGGRLPNGLTEIMEDYLNRDIRKKRGSG